jgi:hypothetical protein
LEERAGKEQEKQEVESAASSLQAVTVSPRIDAEKGLPSIESPTADLPLAEADFADNNMVVELNQREEPNQRSVVAPSRVPPSPLPAREENEEDFSQHGETSPAPTIRPRVEHVSSQRAATNIGTSVDEERRSRETKIVASTIAKVKSLQSAVAQESAGRKAVEQMMMEVEDDRAAAAMAARAAEEKLKALEMKMIRAEAAWRAQPARIEAPVEPPTVELQAARQLMETAKQLEMQVSIPSFRSSAFSVPSARCMRRNRCTRIYIRVQG